VLKLRPRTASSRAARARAETHGTRCAYCHDSLGSSWVACPDCRSQVHSDCAHDGCPSLGCATQQGWHPRRAKPTRRSLDHDLLSRLDQGIAEQVASKPTQAQLGFDVLYGLALPSLALTFLPTSGATAILFAAVPIVALALWLAASARAATGGAERALPPWGRKLLSGGLGFGALVALSTAVAMLGLGVFHVATEVTGTIGASLLATAFVYLRNAVRAGGHAGQAEGEPRAVTPTVETTH
jgi:hypothetical protein